MTNQGKTRFILLILTAIVSCAGNLPSQTATPVSADAVLPGVIKQRPSKAAFIKELTCDTWAYLSSDWATDQHLPWSWRSETLSGGDYVNPAEIGLYALSWLGAYEVQQPCSPTWAEVEAEVTAVLDQLRAWQTGSQTYQPHGPNAYQNRVFYQWYWINWQYPVVGSGAANHVVPSVDNAWLALSLLTIRAYGLENNYPNLADKADAILADMDFTIWYNFDTHQFYWGATENPMGGGTADYYSNENRIINFVARALGQLDAVEFQLSLDALVQEPGSYNGIHVKKIAWDGSYFTYVTPALFIREMETVYGEGTIWPVTLIQMNYAQVQGYRSWGFSDTYDVGAGGYIQQGAPPAGSPNPLETHPGVISPHAIVLALITPASFEALASLSTLLQTFPASYHPQYGFYDSIMTKPNDPQYGLASERFSALNQEWIFLALVNRQIEFIWNYLYYDDGVVQAHEEMYSKP